MPGTWGVIAGHGLLIHLTGASRAGCGSADGGRTPSITQPVGSVIAAEQAHACTLASRVH
jgi:hypothetical protein